MQSNTVVVENQTVNFPSIFLETRQTDPFRVVDKHYVGHDGFVVPKNFDEFHQRFPEYVGNWVRRHVDRSTPKEDVEDWTQDLLIHLRYLPATSKHRESGKLDVVQTFDPRKHHGANSARFFNYINLCLGNKLRSIRSKQMKNPICRPENLSLTTHWDGAEDDQVGDEFCHAHSASCATWSRVELYKEVWDQPLFKLSRKYGISDVRLGKVCRKLKIPHPGRGYWAKRKAGKPVARLPLTAFADAPTVRRLNCACKATEGKRQTIRYNWGTTEKEKEWLSGS